MRIPKQSSGQYRVLKALYGNGTMHVLELAIAADTTPGVVSQTATMHGLQTDNLSYFRLPPKWNKYFDDCEPREEVKLQIAQPREFNFRTPEMVGYAASLWAGKRVAV